MSTPVVTEMRVVPVAGDSMLLNLGGAHGPFFTRNLVLLRDSSGATGAGEVPGGEGIRRTLQDARDLVVGRPIGRSDEILNAVRTAFGHLDAGGRGPVTHDTRITVHALTAIESAHRLYAEHGLGDRDDAAAMEYLVPGWTFDPKRPCLVRG
ncbi:hypothetical protein [Actinomadura sp. GC306]|uniref:hypothetical protein n=1 Tax=Actinomadura sp. GC306 TaxID=2530367 RepID=UPI001FB7DD37|nr:hypothetical protein [Actinomadura sp. GC306]